MTSILGFISPLKRTTGRSIGLDRRARKSKGQVLFVIMLSCSAVQLPGQQDLSRARPSCTDCREPSAIESRPAEADRVHLERCDRLPMVKLRVNGKEMYFLLDTGASSFLDSHSFASKHSGQTTVFSWTGGTTTSVGDVSITELALAGHKLENLRLPSIDLSSIGKGCGRRIDGIFGVDLIQQIGLTIDLQHQVGTWNAQPPDAHAIPAEMEEAMHGCDLAFNLGKADALGDCFEQEAVLYTPAGEFRGRKQVMEYLRKRYLRFAPKLKFEMKVHDVRVFGDALWYSYEYNINLPEEQTQGHGTAMCRRSSGRWRIVNMHNSVLQPDHDD
jgi:hypothetical protein